jgi:hypothetical protein
MTSKMKKNTRVTRKKIIIINTAERKERRRDKLD